MPFKSEAQRRFMFAKHPEIAKRWMKEGKGDIMPGKGKMAYTNEPIGKAGQPPKYDGTNLGMKRGKRSQEGMEAIKRRMMSLKKGKK